MKKILIVEDEFRTRNGLKNLINKVELGCTVVGDAENGLEGLRLIQDLQPDIVITDIRMPKMDGLKMIRQAKEMGIKSTFVILSGYAEFEYAQKGIQLGVQDYLLKPITISLVKELLTKLAGSNESDSQDMPKNQTEYSTLVREIVREIEMNYGMPLELTYFAEKFRLTPEYISNLFAKETGMPFSAYKKKVRLEKAKELILNSDIKIYEVACAVGYPDQKYFSKVFKEYTGVSAKQYALDIRKSR